MAAQSAQIGVAEADLYLTIFINGTLGWDAENFSQTGFQPGRFFGADWHSSSTHAYGLPPSATISLMLCFTSDFEKSEETGDVG